MGVLKVNVNGVWEEVATVAAEPQLDEVWVGQSSPDPAGTAEMWVDLNSDPPVLKFKAQDGEWRPISSGEIEVEVTDAEPTTEWDLWVDTSALAPPPGTAALGINDLTDVDTVTTAPAEGNGLGWSDTASNWVPQPVWKSWSGTQAAFDAITTKDPNCLYAII